MTIAALAYLAVMTAVGHAAHCALVADRGRWSWQVGLSMVVGAAILGQVLLLLSMLGHAPSRVLLLVAAIVAAGVLVLTRSMRRARGWRTPPGPERAGPHWPALLAVGLPLAAAAWIATAQPPEWDGFAIWLLKAKVLASEPLRPLPGYFSDLALGYSHLDYPPLVSMLVAGIYAAVGGVDALAAHIVFFYLFTGLALVLYGALRARLDAFAAAALAFAFLGSPAVLRWAYAPLADVPLAAFHLASVAVLCRALENECEPGAVALAGVLGGAAALAKLEGQPLSLLAAVTLVLLAVAWRNPRVLGASVLFAGVQIFAMAPWLVLSADLPRVHEHYVGRLELVLDAAHRARLWDTIVPELARHMAIGGRWGALWLLAPLLALAGWRAFRQLSTCWLWLVCAAHLALYLVAYVVTPWDPRVLMSVSLERLLLHIAAPLVLLLAAHAASVRGLTFDQPATGRAVLRRPAGGK